MKVEQTIVCFIPAMNSFPFSRAIEDQLSITRNPPFQLTRSFLPDSHFVRAGGYDEMQSEASEDGRSVYTVLVTGANRYVLYMLI